MTTQELDELISKGELDKLKSVLEITKCGYFIKSALGVTGTQISEDLKQYNPKEHKVHSTLYRRDKILKDDKGNFQGIAYVNRISIPEQKKIVMAASMFLGVPELSCTPEGESQKKLLAAMKIVFDDNKLDYQFKDITETTMSERECAELWYTQKAEPEMWAGSALEGANWKLRCRLLSPSRGDTLYPVYDIYGDMIAFGRYYETVEVPFGGNAAMTMKVSHFDIYTPKTFYFLRKDSMSNGWVEDVSKSSAEAEGTASEENPVADNKQGIKGITNPIGKIPVIYYSQPATEWNDVQEMIERLEKKISNHADTNDYFDSPIVFAEGKVTGFSNKADQGKILTGVDGAKVSYLTWDNAPESMKMEIENLIDFIGKYTHTPDFSFNSVKGLGVFSGIALKMFFMDAHMKASKKEQLFGLGVQRRINYLKVAINYITQEFKADLLLVIKPKFTYFLPQDTDGEVSTISKALQGGFMSLATAVKLNPLVQDAEAELVLIKAEKEDAQKAALEKAKATALPPVAPSV